MLTETTVMDYNYNGRFGVEGLDQRWFCAPRRRKHTNDTYLFFFTNNRIPYLAMNGLSEGDSEEREPTPTELCMWRQEGPTGESWLIKH